MFDFLVFILNSFYKFENIDFFLEFSGTYHVFFVSFFFVWKVKSWFKNAMPNWGCELTLREHLINIGGMRVKPSHEGRGSGWGGRSSLKDWSLGRRSSPTIKIPITLFTLFSIFTNYFLYRLTRTDAGGEKYCLTLFFKKKIS